ncbi:MAG: mannose-6-phosphate isomerase, class I [Acidimicrobiales bacterium]
MDRLVGAVQRYAWGDPAFIPRLQGRPVTGEPEAELWFGAHPVAPSRLERSGAMLDALVAADPDGVLGPGAARRFGRFPFLVKVLAAAEPLSIQAHPSLAQARAGHRREEAAGIPWDSPRRTYRDDNHKPELLAALTPFEAKCGFRPLTATRRLIDLVVSAGPTPALVELRSRLDGSPTGTPDLPAAAGDRATVAAVVGWLLGLAPEAAGPLATDVVAACEKLLAGAVPAEAEPFEAELRWTRRLDHHHPGDAGVVVALLLNHVVLAPGEAVYLDAGNLHAYLRGAGVEIMANSDNVVRGGLTAKHVDAPGLLSILDTEPAPAPVQVPSGARYDYQVAAPEFSLTRLSGSGGAEAVDAPAGPEIVLVTEGRAVVTADGAPPIELGPGQAALVTPADGPYRIEVREPGVRWRAGVGAHPGWPGDEPAGAAR